MKIFNFTLAFLICTAISLTTAAVPTYSDVQTSINKINTAIQTYINTTPTTSPINQASLNKIETNVKAWQTAFENSKTIILSYRDGNAPTLTSTQVASVNLLITAFTKSFTKTTEAVIHIQANVAALNANKEFGDLFEGAFDQMSEWVTAFTNIIYQKDIGEFYKVTDGMLTEADNACKAYGGKCY